MGGPLAGWAHAVIHFGTQGRAGAPDRPVEDGVEQGLPRGKGPRPAAGRRQFRPMTRIRSMSPDSLRALPLDWNRMVTADCPA